MTVKELLETNFGNKFQYHPAFLDEFDELIQESDSKEKILQMVYSRLSTVLKLGDINYGIGWIEHLKHEKNMYSLHVNVDKKNYRLIFTRNRNGKYFLHAFYERSGKSSTSYKKHIEIAKSRLKE